MVFACMAVVGYGILDLRIYDSAKVVFAPKSARDCQNVGTKLPTLPKCRHAYQNVGTYILASAKT